ncbi:Quiescin sulfhydryl oxidase 1 [Carabus blaptoides fortunei]
MIDNKIFPIQFLIVCACVHLVYSAALSVNEQKKYKQLIEGQGLYTVDDNIEIFTAQNFKNKLYGQKQVWFIEFYNSWCGFCQRFAPSWKALGTDVRGWKDLVGIGAIDCSDEDNASICREFEILGYPTLRYFHEDYVEGAKNLGTDVKKGEDMDALRRNLVEQLLKEQQDSRAKSLPPLLPYTESSVNDIFNGVADTVQFAFIIVEDKTNTSVEVALDLHKVPEILIRSVKRQENNDFIQNYHIASYPKVLAVNRVDKSVEHFNNDIITRDGILKAIKDFLKPKGIEISEEKKENLFKGKWIENEIPDIAALLEARERQTLRQKVKQMGDVVFQMDLETALRYSLKHEVATTKRIDGEKLDALKMYLNVIVKYFPTGRKGKNFLEDLLTEINSHGASVMGVDIANFIRPSDNEDEGIFSSPQQWLGCSGSTGKYRGYPCGMWTMFHYLTVNAADQNMNRENAKPREVLEAMHAYIKNFFGCADCSKHFQAMAKKNDLQSVSELNSSIIWLWIAHNEVNKRLAGDATEDPEHPKIQFPSQQHCPKCRDGDKWNLTEVLQYLRHMYSSINVRYLGSDTKVLHDGLGSTSSRSKRSTSWAIINSMDVSMCFVLYVVCFGLLVVIVRQFLRKGYKKKMYVHDLLGKV